MPIDKIEGLSLSEKKKVDQFVDFILFIRKNKIRKDKKGVESFLLSQGFSSIESFVRKIKEIPFTRTDRGYIYGALIKAWITSTFECTEEVATNILSVTNEMGLLCDSGYGNYG